MDDKKMKIRVVVQPEETRRAAEAAEREREVRVRRRRYGVAALSGLVAVSLIAALLLFLSGENRPQNVADQPAATSSSTASSPSAAAPYNRQATPQLGASLAESPASGAANGNVSDGNGQTALAPSDRGTAPAPGIATADNKPGNPASTSEPSPPAAGAAITVGSGGIPRADAPAPADRPASPDSQKPASVPSTTSASAPQPSQQQSQSPTSPSSTAAPAPGTPAMAPTPAPAAKGAAKATPKQSTAVARAQLTSRVVGREPVDTLRSPVDARSGRDVYYFTEFRGLGGHTVAHRWELKGEVLATIPFKIGADRWRVYSSKRVWPNQQGPWRVSAIDNNGTVLAASDFVVE